MKQFGLAGILLCWLIAGCGKVGDPHPPAIRIPAKVDDLAASQNMDRVTLIWTNPSRNVDGTKVDDLTKVTIWEGDKDIKTVPASLPGKQQMEPLDVRDQLNTTRIYTVTVTTRRDKKSGPSNAAPIKIVDFPGQVSSLTGAMDQHRIQLTWKPPQRNPTLTDVYLVRRTDGGIQPQQVSEPKFVDESVETGKTYTYIVTAGHIATSAVFGPESSAVVPAKDEIPPGKPKGLQVIASESGAIIQWDSNPESDIAGYNLERRQDPAAGFVLWSTELIKGRTSIRDPQYKPGFSYRIQAVDADGNKSEFSDPTN